jgi:GAF domain-containing protein
VIELEQPELHDLPLMLDQFLLVAESTYRVRHDTPQGTWHLEKDIEAYRTVAQCINRLVAGPCLVWSYYKEKASFLYKASAPPSLANSEDLLDSEKEVTRSLNEIRACILLEGDTLAQSPGFCFLADLFGLPRLLVMPLSSPKQSEFVGIAVCGLPDHVVLEDEQIAVLERFATQAALAIDHARLVERMATVEEVVADISTQANSLGVLELILEKALELPKFSTGQLYLADGVQQRLNLVVWRSESDMKPPESIRFGQGILGEVAETQTPRYIEDFSQCSPSEIKDIDHHSGSLFAVPVMTGDELVGVLSIESARVGAFTELDCYLISEFARLASVAVWGFLRMMDLAYISLEWASETHILGSTTSYLMWATSTLLDRIKKGEIDNETTRLAERIAARTGESHRRLSEMHDVFDVDYTLGTPLFSPRGRIEPISLESMLKALVQGMKERNAEKSIVIEFVCKTECCEVNGIRALLNIAFQQILENSWDELTSGTGGTISVTLSDHIHGLEATISDTGAGIPEEIRQHVFDSGFTTKSTHAGIGLSIAQNVIECHGGSIHFAESHWPGATCVVVLPSRKGV